MAKQSGSKQENASTKSRVRKKKTPVSEALAYVQATFNNTIVTITDKSGNTLASASAGSSGFTNSRKSTPHAAKMAAEKAISQAVKERGVETLTVFIAGPGPGRESAARGLQHEGVSILQISDITPVPHNGVRPENPRSA